MGKTYKVKLSEHDMLPDVLTVGEVAALMRVNRNTVYESFRRGEIPGGRRLGKRIIRFSRRAMLEWLAAGNGPISESSRRQHDCETG